MHTKTHNRVEWTAACTSLSKTKVNDINLNDRNRMQNDTENEIGSSLFPFHSRYHFAFDNGHSN